MVDDRQIMQWWREAGLPESFLGNGGTNAKLAAFAAMVRQDEREKCASISPNGLNISAADMPHVVWEKYRAAILSQPPEAPK